MSSQGHQSSLNKLVCSLPLLLCIPKQCSEIRHLNVTMFYVHYTNAYCAPIKGQLQLHFLFQRILSFLYIIITAFAVVLQTLEPSVSSLGGKKKDFELLHIF